MHGTCLKKPSAKAKVSLLSRLRFAANQITVFNLNLRMRAWASP